MNWLIKVNTGSLRFGVHVLRSHNHRHHNRHHHRHRHCLGAITAVAGAGTPSRSRSQSRLPGHGGLGLRLGQPEHEGASLWGTGTCAFSPGNVWLPVALSLQVAAFTSRSHGASTHISRFSASTSSLQSASALHTGRDETEAVETSPTPLDPFTQLIELVCKDATNKMKSPEDPDDYFKIINAPEDTARHPFMYDGFSDVADEVISTKGRANVNPDSRKKPFTMIVAGIGRGKTRTLMELHQELNKREGVLAIAITFNRNWNIKATECRFSKNREFNYATSIATRVISMHYRATHDDVINSFKSNYKKVGKDAIGTDLPIKIIQETIKYIVEKGNVGQPVNQFVLLVDEARCAETSFGKGVHNNLRQALLDTELLPTLDVRLVMASLDITSSGVSDSGRAIKTLTVVDSLPPARVLDEWLVPHVNRHVHSAVPFAVLNSKDRLNLMMAIAVTTRLPRATEYLIDAVTDAFAQSVMDNQPLVLDGVIINHLFDVTCKSLDARYPALRIPLPLKYAKALLFEEFVIVINVVMKLIRKSKFTNSIKILQPDGDTVIVPETSAVSMYLMKDVGTAYGKALLKIEEELSGYMLGRKGIYNAGYPLEVVARGMTNTRLGVMVDTVATKKKKLDCTLQSLLRVVGSTVMGDVSVQNLLGASITFSPRLRVVGVHLDVPLSYSNETKVQGHIRREFLEEINRVRFNDSGPSASYAFTSVILHPDECADACWLLRAIVNGVPCSIALFEDAKAAEIAFTGPTKDATGNAEKVIPNFESICTRATTGDVDSIKALQRSLPSSGRQARRWAAVASKLKEMVDEGLINLQRGSLAEALVEGRYLYVYLNTRQKETFGVNGNILHMGRSDCERFLSFFKEQYEVCRSQSSEGKIL